MKFSLGIIVLTSLTMSGLEDDRTFSVLDSGNQPRMIDQGEVVTKQETVLEKIEPQLHRPSEARLLPTPGHANSVAKPALIEYPLVDDSFTSQPMAHQSFFPVESVQPCCGCKHLKCRCKRSQFVETTLHLVDGAGCVHEACMRVPHCCLNEAPTVSWKGKLFGRQVATLCWACCDHEVKVVISRRGKVRVRD